MHITAALFSGLLTAVLAADPAVAAGQAAGHAARQQGHHGGVACAALPVVAHRGAHSRRVTEDSAASFAGAVALGADTVEGDARLSANGTWFLMHDATVNRTTHGRGQVARMTDAQLASIAYDDGRVGISTLDAALAPLDAGTDATLQIEIKPRRVGLDSLRSFLDILVAHGLRDRVVITSFHRRVIAGLHAVDPAWPTALVLTHAPRRVARLAGYGGQVDLEERAVSARTVRRLHRAGIRVQSWTVDSHSGLRRVVQAGIDGVITDRLTRTRSWCRKTS